MYRPHGLWPFLSTWLLHAGIGFSGCQELHSSGLLCVCDFHQQTKPELLPDPDQEALWKTYLSEPPNSTASLRAAWLGLSLYFEHPPVPPSKSLNTPANCGATGPKGASLKLRLSKELEPQKLPLLFRQPSCLCKWPAPGARVK